MSFCKRKFGWLLFVVLVACVVCLIAYMLRSEISDIFDKDDVKPEIVVEKNAFGMPVGFVSMKGNIIGDIQEDENGVLSFSFESINLYEMNGIYKIMISWGLDLDESKFSVGGEKGNSVGFDDFKTLISKSKNKTVTLDVFLMNDQLWNMTVGALSERGVDETILGKYQEEIFCTVRKFSNGDIQDNGCSTLVFYNLSV